MRGIHGALAEIYRRTGRADWAAEAERRERQAAPLNCAREPRACEFAQGEHRALIDRVADASTPEALYWKSLAASELAREAFARVEAMPATPESHAIRAEAYRIRGLYKLAIDELNAALKLSPGDRELRRLLAQAQWLNGDYEQAQPLLESLQRELPNDISVTYQLGDTLLQLQKPDAAIPLLSTAVQLAPEHSGARVALARALVRMGEWTQSIPHLEAALADDEDGSLHLLLARAYAATGSDIRSGELMQKAQALQAAAAARRAALNEETEITAP